MQVYFFKHPLISRHSKHGVIPGRYGYDIEGQALSATNKCLHLREFRGQIYGDACGDNQPGSNVDPNVLAEVIPWFLSYCRICTRADHNLVLPEKRLLSEVVQRGDVIVFGGDEDNGRCLGLDVIFVDTLLRVDVVVEIPRKYPPNGKGLDVQEYCLRQSAVLSLPTWREFKKSRDFRYNLVDAMPPPQVGAHYTSKVGVGNPHLQIVGTRFADQQNKVRSSSIEDLIQRFVGGRGFNFCPLLSIETDYSLLTSSSEIARRRGLFVTNKVEGVSAALSHQKVVRLPSKMGESLLNTIIHQAKELVLDPVIPTQILKQESPSCH